MRFPFASLAVATSLLNNLAAAIVLDVSDAESIRDAAALAAHGAQQIYNGNKTGGTVGKWPFPPYYWWESGGAWGSMLQYYLYTGDASYNQVLHDALVAQLGPAFNFIDAAQVLDTGNDDQAFWTFTAMTAAEHNFPALPEPAPAWHVVVENVWNLFTHRWNTTYCNGGLKWQFTPTNQGFNYKQTISNGAFFQLSARLARFTGNQTYLDWAEKIWDWSRAIGLVDDLYNVYDGSDELINCTGVDHHQWSYNVGAFLYGSAVLSNLTASTTWMQRTSGLLDATSTFITPFKNSSDIIFEAECEFLDYCNTDQHSMKAYLVRWMAGTSQMAPYTAGRIGILLRSSAMGAVAACTGGPYGNTCGTKWYVNGYDNIPGLGQQIAAMEVIGGLLINRTTPPGTMSGVRLPGVPASMTKILLSPTGTARALHDPIDFVNTGTGGNRRMKKERL